MLIAELRRAEGARAEPHTLENLVTHRSQKCWLSRDCPYVRQVPCLEKEEKSTITIGTSLILEVHVRIDKC